MRSGRTWLRRSANTPSWLRGLRESSVVQGILASLPMLPATSLATALEEIRQQRRRGEDGVASTVDVLAAAIVIEILRGQSSLDGDPRGGPSGPGIGPGHFEKLGRRQPGLDVADLAEAVRAVASRMNRAPGALPTVLIIDDDLDMRETCAAFSGSRWV